MAENINTKVVNQIADILIDASKEISANSGFDKTYIGSIAEVMFNKDTLPTDDNYNKYKIRYGTLENDFIIDDGKAHSLNEKVQVIVPCDNLKDKVVEAENCLYHPIDIIYEDGSKTKTVVIKNESHVVVTDTITESWQIISDYEINKQTQAYDRDEETGELIPLKSFTITKQYQIYVENKNKYNENCLAIIFPTGEMMTLEGF